MNERTRAAIFLFELLIVITVFSVCAAVCAWIFTDAFIKSQAANDLNNAVIFAQNAAEAFKVNPEESIAYYDKDWRLCGAEDAEYVLYVYSNRISAEKSNGEVILSFGIAAGGLT